MTRFFPREAVSWGEERLHPLRAFGLRTLEPAGLAGIVLRLWRVALLNTDQWPLFVAGLTVAVLLLCGVVTWHLGNYPVRRWPMRTLLFLLVEVFAELGTSSVLIVFGLERLGSGTAVWSDWWSLAAQTVVQRALVVLPFVLVLAFAVQMVRRSLDRRAVAEPIAGEPAADPGAGNGSGPGIKAGE